MTTPERKSKQTTSAKTRLIYFFGSSALLTLAVLNPQSVQAHGELLIRITAVTRQIETATNNAAKLYLQRGELHREHQDWRAAETDYARAAQLDPNLLAVDFCRARMLAESGQLEAARVRFEKVINRSPKNGEAFIGRARVLATLGQRETAISDYRQALELLQPPTAEHFLELAQVLKAQQQPDKALATIDEGIKKLGPVVPLQDYALQLELERKNHEAALARIDSILKQTQRKEDWLVQQGDILLATGRTGQARQSFEAALAAIKQLPWRIQQNPPVVKMQARIHTALSRIANPSAPGSREDLVTARE